MKIVRLQPATPAKATKNAIMAMRRIAFTPLERFPRPGGPGPRARRAGGSDRDCELSAQARRPRNGKCREGGVYRPAAPGVYRNFAAIPDVLIQREQARES